MLLMLFCYWCCWLLFKLAGLSLLAPSHQNSLTNLINWTSFFDFVLLLIVVFVANVDIDIDILMWIGWSILICFGVADHSYLARPSDFSQQNKMSPVITSQTRTFRAPVSDEVKFRDKRDALPHTKGRPYEPPCQKAKFLSTCSTFPVKLLNIPVK